MSLITRTLCWGIASVCWAVSVSYLTADAPLQTVKYRDHYRLNPQGDAQITRTYTFPPAVYARVKQQTNDPLMLMRQMSSNLDWHDIRILNGRFDDGSHQVIMELEQKGLARTAGPGQWELKSRGKPGSMELISCDEQHVIFHAADFSEWGPLSASIILDLAPGTRDVKFDGEKAVVKFQLEPPTPSEEFAGEPWRLETSERLMTSLAKVYSNETFGLFWTARSIFVNTETEPVTKYQVRYQIEGFSSWSPWQRTPIVYPGQSVVDGFFPVLDIDTLSRLDGSRRGNLIVEYRYVNADGETIEQTDSRPLEILARNEVVFSRRTADNSVNWQEANEFLPILVAAFCNSNDPVVQQLAGGISGMADGPAASLASEDAVKFLKATWKFLDDNKVAYQTSPSLEVDQRFGQHVKYARDVLSNRAGTCIDLAIFWASAAKAVGLKSYIVIVPGHAFPMIELPNGARLPIESTLLGKGESLDKAVEVGQLQLEKALAGSHFLVDINQMETQGVRSLDLSPVSEDFLSKLKYVFKPLPAESN